MKFKPAWKKEPKAMGLKSAYKPQTGSCVSGVVVVNTKDGEVGTANVRFNKELEEMLGKKMPYGVGPQDPAFLKVIWIGWTYEVRGCYLNHGAEILLWNLDELPEWCNRFRPLPRRSEDERHASHGFAAWRSSDVRFGKRQNHPMQGAGAVHGRDDRTGDRRGLQG